MAYLHAILYIYMHIHMYIITRSGITIYIYVYITRILTFLHIGIGTAKLRGHRGVCSDDRPAPDQG